MFNQNYFQLFFIFVIFSHVSSAPISQNNEQDPDVMFITISSVHKFKIEINWNFTTTYDEIALYFQQPPFANVKPKLTIEILEDAGHFMTNEIFSLDQIPNQWKYNDNDYNITKGPINLDYCLAAIKNKTIMKTSCYRIQPTWMNDNGNIIGNIPITELMIPGTHNSGCYGDHPAWDIKDPVFRYVYTQDVDVWNQLVFGIRYFDVRVGYYNTTFVRNSFWINHDKFKVNPLKDFFYDIKNYLSRAKDEILILDLHRFPVGFKNPKKHIDLKALIDQELGDLIVPRSYQNPPFGPTLNDLWKQKGRIIICYADDFTASNSDNLWDPLNQKWGNKQKPNDLKDYLNSIQHDHGSYNDNKLWAAMAELTPTSGTIVEGIMKPHSPYHSLAHMANYINRDVTSWYRFGGCDTNIVATDYFLGNDIINVAIECNQKKKYL